MALRKWNPFKFRRNKHEKGNVPVQHKATTAAVAAPPLEPLWWNWPTMHDWGRDPWSALARLESPSFERWFGDFSPARFTPSLDVVDEDGALKVTVDLPGLTKSDVEVLAEEDYLTIKGEKKYDSTQEESGCYRVERAYGAFQRTIPLPDDVDAQKADAKFDSGVLTIRIPRKPQAQSSARRIELQ